MDQEAISLRIRARLSVAQYLDQMDIRLHAWLPINRIRSSTAAEVGNRSDFSFRSPPILLSKHLRFRSHSSQKGSYTRQSPKEVSSWKFWEVASLSLIWLLRIQKLSIPGRVGLKSSSFPKSRSVAKRCFRHRISLMAVPLCSNWGLTDVKITRSQPSVASYLILKT